MTSVDSSTVTSDEAYRTMMEEALANMAAEEPAEVLAPSFIDDALVASPIAWAISYKTSAGGRGPKR